MGSNRSYQSETAPVSTILMRSPSQAYISQSHLNTQWHALNYEACPDFDEANREFELLIQLFEEHNFKVHLVDGFEHLSADSIYVRDASILTDRGAILCRMGKDARAGEPALLKSAYTDCGIPILGEISGTGKVEGGDTFWLDANTFCIALGYRTNQEGINQVRSLLGEKIKVIEVDLPHFCGPSDVFHLMSIISPLTSDLALVYSPLMPVRFRNELLSRNIQLIEVPEDEFNSIGGNVLSLGNKVCLMLEGNPKTRSRLEGAGLKVLTYKGEEISFKGMGGPTCLTRPLLRKISF